MESYFSKEVAGILDSIEGVILNNNEIYSIKYNALLKENVGIVLELSFKDIEKYSERPFKNRGFIAGFDVIAGADYLMLNTLGTDMLRSMGGINSKHLKSLDCIGENNYIGYGLRLIPKNHSTLSFALNNIVSTEGFAKKINAQEMASDDEVFGSRDLINFDVNGHNDAIPKKDTYDYVIRHFK